MKIGDRFRLAWRAITQRAVTLDDIPAIRDVLLAEGGGSAGPVVTERTAKNLASVWKAVVLLSSQVASLPLIPYRRTEGGRERAENTTLWRLLHEEPNEYQNPFELREAMMHDALLTKGGFAEIERDRANRPLALHHIPSSQIQVEVLEDGRRIYRQTGRAPIPGVDMLDVAPPLGIPPVGVARLSLSLGLALDHHGAAFFRNGAWPGVVLQMKGSLTDKAKERLIDSVNGYLRGPDKHYKMLVTEDETEVKSFSMNMRDSQFLESKSFTVEEVARWFNLPPHKLGHKMGERPGGNLTESQIEYLTDSLRPWLIKFEQEFGRKLIPRDLRTSMYLEHLVDAILRVDAKTRHRIILESTGGPYRSLNEGRRLENLPDEDGGEGVRPPTAPVTVPPEDDRERRRSAVFRELVRSTAARFVRRELADARRAVERANFAEWAEANERRDLKALAEFLRPLVAYRLVEIGDERPAEEVAENLARRHLRATREAYLDLPAASVREGLEDLAERWQHRPDEIADAVLGVGRQSDAA